MKILAVSDVVEDRLYSPQVREIFGNVDLVVGCGDLPYEYLEFLVSVLNVPLLFVPGNHDPLYDKSCDIQARGCIFLDQRVERVKGLTLAGMGGCVRYKPEGVNQYTQQQMYFRLLPLMSRLLSQHLCYHAPLDVMITHAPPRGVHDDDDLAHNGFSAFRDFIHIFKPRFFLHGHTMFYKTNLISPEAQLDTTTVVNVYPYRVIEVKP